MAGQLIRGCPQTGNSARETNDVRAHRHVHEGARTVVTIVDNSEEVPHLTSHSKLVTSKHHSHEPLSSASGIYKTVVYSRTIKDACCRPTEEKVLCFQCSRYHYEHNKESPVAIFATKSGELHHAFVAHGKHPDPNMMRDILIKSTTTTTTTFM